MSLNAVRRIAFHFHVLPQRAALSEIYDGFRQELVFEDILQNGLDLCSDPARLHQFAKLLVNVLYVAAFARSDGANDDKISIGVNAIDDSVSCEFVFVVIHQRSAERSAVTQRVGRWLFVENVLKFTLNTSVEVLNVFQAIQRELYLEDHDLLNRDQLKASSME